MEKRVSVNRILITGSSGQLGQELQEIKDTFRDAILYFTTREDFDICDPEVVATKLDEIRPDLIINTAAYTAVDLAEEEKEIAQKVNTTAVRNLAQECLKRAIGLLHISTDYVFDGSANRYFPNDLTSPQTVYGKTKCEGENAILASGLKKYAIIRTSWVYSKYGNNFVKTMLKLARDRSTISVVNDQVGSPTWARDLAVAIAKVAAHLDEDTAGSYHFSNKGEVSWYAFAKAIFSNTQKDIEVIPIPSIKYVTAAKRPKRSVLDSSKISETFGVAVPTWEESLVKMLSSMANDLTIDDF